MANDLEQAIVAKLASVSAITALVGDRIYAKELEQEVDYPALNYFRVDTPRIHALDGPAGLAYPRIQIGIFSDNFADLPIVSKQLRLALDGFSGVVDGFTIGAVELADERDEPFEPETKTFQRILDFIVWHNE